jgi:cell wall assembly regulator SMI1
MRQLPGVHQWFSLGDVMRRWRVATCTTYELLSTDAAGFQADNSVQPTQAVRQDVWNRNWLPIAETGVFRRWVCLDMAPGPAGEAGQVIEVMPFHHGHERRADGPRAANHCGAKLSRTGPRI